MTEETKTEEIVEEIVQEEEQEQEPVGEVEQEQPQVNLDMSFDDLGVPDDIAAQPAEPDYGKVVEDIVSKVLEQQKVKSEEDKSSDDDDDITYLSKKELAEYEAKLEQKIMNKLQEQQKSVETIQQTVQASEHVRMQYQQKFISKLAENGVNLEENPQLKNVAAMLFDNLKIQAGARAGRLVVDPATGQPQALLTPQEMKQVVQQHWDSFAKTYIPNYQALKPAAKTAPLSAAANGTKPEGAVDTDDAYQQFLEKKSRGQETLGDALNLLLKSSGKK